MKIKNLHSWKVSPAEAIKIQSSLKSKLTQQELSQKVELVAGADSAFDKERGIIYSAIVVLKIGNMEVVESSWASDYSDFPYIPGLLTFREGPALLKALRKLSIIPDVIIFDGQGIAHPRSMGIAAHIGLFIEIPTIGCAKSRLIGDYSPVDQEAGCWSALKRKGEIIGAVLRSRKGVKPIFVSPGNRIDLASSIAIVLRCCRKYRLPQPIRKAHILCGKISRSANKTSLL